MLSYPMWLRYLHTHHHKKLCSLNVHDLGTNLYFGIKIKRRHKWLENMQILKMWVHQAWCCIFRYNTQTSQKNVYWFLYKLIHGIFWNIYMECMAEKWNNMEYSNQHENIFDIYTKEYPFQRSDVQVLSA